MNALPVYDDRYINTEIRTHGDKAYTNFWGLDMPENGVEWKYFAVISNDLLLVYNNKYYLKVYLENCAYKVVDNQMIDYLDDNVFETDED